MLIENAIHSQQVYDPTDDSIMAEQELCMERLYDYNHTRPSEHVKRARLLKEMLAECGAGSDYNQRKTGSSVGELPALLIACGFLQGVSGWRTLFLLSKRSKLYSVHRPYQTVSSVPESGGD